MTAQTIASQACSCIFEETCTCLLQHVTSFTFGQMCLQGSGIDDDVVVMTEDFDDFMDEDAVVVPGSSKSEVSDSLKVHPNIALVIYSNRRLRVRLRCKLQAVLPVSQAAVVPLVGCPIWHAQSAVFAEKSMKWHC